MKIGVFDSGVGGLSVANSIRHALPEHEVMLREDKEHVPYGTRSPADLVQLVMPVLEEMVHAGCSVIVVACNTVSTNLIDQLRQRFSLPLVAVEPMVKPAAELTKSGVIAVCATPTTLMSQRYAWLKSNYAQNVKVLEPDCSDWALMIENDQLDRDMINQRTVEVLKAGADVIVLACTHYHWIEDEIIAAASGRAKVLQPEQAIIEQLKRVLARLG